MSWQKFWATSRPRFWIYVFGPFLVGSLAGVPTKSGLLAPATLCWALFFLLPANLLIYGVNDIFDYETDSRNPKKRGYEGLVPPDDRPALWRAIGLCCVPFLLALPHLNVAAAVALLAFLLLATQYSAPPLRAKARPLLDSASNFLYALPGVVGYLIHRDVTTLHPSLLVAALCWTMAMHAYSAVPDISADKEAQLQTIATWLGQRGTLLACLSLYLLAGGLAMHSLPVAAPVLMALYATLMIISLRQQDEAGVLRIYRFFPALNTLAGMGLFFQVLWLKGWLAPH